MYTLDRAPAHVSYASCIMIGRNVRSNVGSLVALMFKRSQPVRCGRCALTQTEDTSDKVERISGIDIFIDFLMLIIAAESLLS